MFGITDRRHFMAHAAAGAAVTVPGMSFLTQLRAAAPELKKKQKSLIILWMAGTTTSRREQRRLQHQDLSRGQLLDAAEEVFGRKGFHEATLKEVAELAEFSVG